MNLTIFNAPFRIDPDVLGPKDCFVGSSNACKRFKAVNKGYYEINLHARLNDVEKKRRLGALIRTIKTQPLRTFYLSAIGCGRGRVDREIIEHLTKPLVWLDNVRLPATFLIDLLRDVNYMSQQDEEHAEALKAWHRRYCSNGEKVKNPGFHKAAWSYGREVTKEVWGIISEYELKKGLYRNDTDFQPFMNRLRSVLETLTSVPLPDCLDGRTDNWQVINLGGKAHLYMHGFNQLANTRQHVVHNLRSDLKQWVAKDENKDIFAKLEHLRQLCNDWSHDGNKDNYDTLAEEVLTEFKYFITRFTEFLAQV